MIVITLSEMFDLITRTPNWYEATADRNAYCNSKEAAVLCHRHRAGKLSQKQYDDLAYHFGFKKQLLYIKNT